MSLEYTINAYSPSLHQSVREFNLADQTPLNQQQAEQIARAFAHRLNSQQHMHTTDWESQVKLEELGIHTIPGYRR